MLNLTIKTLVFLTLIFNFKIINGQGVTCPNNNNLGTFICSDLNTIPLPPTTPDQATSAPYNIEINNNRGEILVSSNDSGDVTNCGVTRVIARTVVIQSVTYDDFIPIFRDLGECKFNITILNVPTIVGCSES